MKLAKIELNQANNYSYKDSNDASLKLLAYFLTDDCGCSRVNNWVDWLKNQQYQDTESNFTFIENEGNDIVMVVNFQKIHTDGFLKQLLMISYISFKNGKNSAPPK